MEGGDGTLTDEPTRVRAGSSVHCQCERTPASDARRSPTAADTSRGQRRTHAHTRGRTNERAIDRSNQRTSGRDGAQTERRIGYDRIGQGSKRANKREKREREQTEERRTTSKQQHQQTKAVTYTRERNGSHAAKRFDAIRRTIDRLSDQPTDRPTDRSIAQVSR